jgi:alpha-D-ribose 1-methylphosphonate 5-triphosphate diphosphatase
VSANPAAAAGLTDRGAIAEGLRADVIVVDPAIPRVVATIANGRIAHMTADGASRLS